VVVERNESSRIERERAFHDERYTEESRDRVAKYYESGDAGYERYLDQLSDVRPGERVLEFGCGLGGAVFELAARGAEVVGIDISPVAVRAASAEAQRRGVTARFSEMNAEALDFDAATFDVVCGSGVLHHLDLAAALPEIAEVLRPGGWATFYEPLGQNPVINLYRRLTPSLRTPDEHPLVAADLRLMAQHFDRVDVEYFNLLSLLGVLTRRLPRAETVRRGLKRLDQWLFRAIPITRRLAWIAVIRLSGPRSPTST
jgi:SAM-dependent methyltransferase